MPEPTALGRTVIDIVTVCPQTSPPVWDEYVCTVVNAGKAWKAIIHSSHWDCTHYWHWCQDWRYGVTRTQNPLQFGAASPGFVGRRFVFGNDVLKTLNLSQSDGQPVAVEIEVASRVRLLIVPFENGLHSWKWRCRMQTLTNWNDANVPFLWVITIGVLRRLVRVGLRWPRPHPLHYFDAVVPDASGHPITKKKTVCIH